ncbi:Modifier of rudimentary [Trypanosoma melophagium]|uniref:Modifier of rudimentary n=1 Tax=Trypanosoma melophagium TaxID=715481 RepID=UPI00351A692C|nr:Modifier of rudimentary [Trypanosoma melophagium]
MSQQQQQEAHINELKRHFEGVRVVRQTPSETLLQVDHINPDRGYTLMLYVALDSKFPQTPPTVAYFSGRKIPIIAMETDNATSDGWNPETSRLVDAVAVAFSNLANLWGSAVPPSMDQITSQLESLSDSMLEDIISNPNCLESYAYQLPFLKGIRDASGQTIDDIERVAKENLTLQPEVEGLRKEVDDLQQRLDAQLSILKKTQASTPLLDSIGTPEALAKTFAADVRMLDTQCEDIAKELLSVDCNADRRRFDGLLEEYRKKAKERHIMDLKRRAYHASLN